MELEHLALEFIARHAPRLQAIAGEIWRNPELALQEHHAARLLANELEQAGFEVETGTGGMPTAFVARWGQGRPYIGILAEYDALPGLSQTVSALPEPVNEGAPGHGCGHNLFGAACLGAALAAQAALRESRLPGTLFLYGCPAEETLAGKVFMAKAGAFDELDAALTWHPGAFNTAASAGNSSLALNMAKFNFHGLPAHAAAAPHMGKSALDAAILMDVGVNYLREHVEPEVRLHSVITNGGGAPNVVPPYAQIWYYVRAPRRDQVEKVYQRVLDIAQGAALMTATTYDVDFVTGCYDLLENQALDQLMHEKLQKLGGPGFSAEDLAFAAELQRSVDPAMLEMGLQRAMRHFNLQPEDLASPLSEAILVETQVNHVMSGSTDVGDVSHIVPTGGNLSTACAPIGTPPHSWQTVAAAGSGIGFKGMLLAAKVLALSALELVEKPELLRAARDEFEKATRGKPYVSPIPDGVKPHAY